MKRAMLIKDLESKYTPEAVKENLKISLYGEPGELGAKLAKDNLKKINFKQSLYN